MCKNLKQIFPSRYFIVECKYLIAKHGNFGEFLNRLFPHLEWIQKFTLYISAFSPNGGNYVPEKLQIRNFSHSDIMSREIDSVNIILFCASKSFWYWFIPMRIKIGPISIIKYNRDKQLPITFLNWVSIPVT